MRGRHPEHQPAGGATERPAQGAAQNPALITPTTYTVSLSDTEARANPRPAV